MATQPNRARRASTKEYAGRIAAFLRIVLRLLEDSAAVTEWGYMNSAMAEPKASVTYAQFCAGGTRNVPVGLLGSALLGEDILVSAEEKMWSQPPIFDGNQTIATITTR